jgi:aspartyl-tRNA(Asn)/glutamyl-tRNA(Gln) amidotransferase subunit B
LELANYFEKAVESIPEIAENSEIKRAKARKVSGWIINELLGRLNKFSVQLSESKVKPESIAELVEMIDKGEISGKVAKEVFDEVFESGAEPTRIVEEKSLKQVSDTGELDSIIESVIAENEKSVDDYKAGKQQVFGFLVGQVMAKTKGQANPKIVNEILREKLK